MTKGTDLEKLSQLMLEEFGRVHDRFNEVDRGFSAIASRFDGIENHLMNIETEMRDIRERLDRLEEAARNSFGFAREIDHLLRRLGAIEKHLGLNIKIDA